MVLLDQGVEQPALARVGRADQDDPGVARRPVAPAEAPGDGGDLGPRGFELRGQRGPAQRIDVGLIDEIEVRLEMGHKVEQPLAERDDRLREAAGQLLQAPHRAGAGFAIRSRPGPPRRG